MAIVCLSGQQKISLLLHEALLSQTTTGTSPSTSRLTTQHPNPKPRLLRPILPLQLQAICFSLHKCMLTCRLVSCWWCFAQGWGEQHNCSASLPSCTAAKKIVAHASNCYSSYILQGQQYTYLLQHIVHKHTAVCNTNMHCSIQYTYLEYIEST